LNVAAASIAAPRPKSIPASRLSKHRTMSAPTSRKATGSNVRELQFFPIAQVPFADDFVCCGFLMSVVRSFSSADVTFDSASC
jgi:hypothetical protein